MDSKDTESPPKLWQPLDSKSQTENNTEEANPNNNSEEDWDHYWFCPFFAHHSHCQYLNFAVQDYSYFPAMMPSDYYMSAEESVNPSNPVQCSSMKKSTQSPKSGPPVDRIYSCCLCDQMKNTSDVLALRKHIEDHLGKVRPFVCGVCGKEFKFRSNCRNHLIAHSILRKYNRSVAAQPQPPPERSPEEL